MKTLNLTESQLDYLQELVMFAYEMEVPEQKGWDIQTYDNLVDEVMKWKISSILRHRFETMWKTTTNTTGSIRMM